MNQIIFIRWWEAFYTNDQFYTYLKKQEYNPFKKKKSWRDWISWAVSESFEVMEPEMPNKQNAEYKAWKIWFEKLFPYLWNEKIILIGSSLWGMFLVKYLSENNFPKEIFQLHLVAPVFCDEWLKDEYVWDFAFDTDKISQLESKIHQIYFYFSEDDPILPFKQYMYYKEHFPKSHIQIFQDRQHFSQPSFPELLENINKYL